MKLEIYRKQIPTNVTKLKLTHYHAIESVVLEVVDECGQVLKGGNILRIDEGTGRISICCSVDPNFGFDLDENRRVRIVR